MEILIAGASGFIGKQLTDQYRKEGHGVQTLTREDFTSETLEKKVNGKDVVINLVGEPITGRWTKAKKRRILTSRVNSTKSLVEAISTVECKPAVFVQASAIGIYDDFHSHDEESTCFGKGFLAEVVQLWENAAEKLKDRESKTRLVIMRLGIVLGKEGGMLKGILFPYRFSMGVRPGKGNYVCSFIHVRDLGRAILFLIENKDIAGIVNVVSPQRSTCDHLHTLLFQMLKPLLKITIPDFVLKLIFGEGAGIMVRGQEVIPGVLKRKGFAFQYAELDKALADIVL